MGQSAIQVSSFIRAGVGDDEPQTFRDQALSGHVLLDNATFERCAFKNARLVYAGGPPPSLSGCSFEGVAFEFQGAAGRTLALLQAMSAPSGGFRDIFKASFPKMFGH